MSTTGCLFGRAWSAALLVAAGTLPSIRPAGGETVAALGNFGPNTALLSTGTVASIVAETGNDGDAALPVEGLSGGFKWQSGALASNGAIYACPLHARMVLKVDPATDSVSVFGSVGVGSNKWRHAVLASNGNIYCIPDTASQVLKISPATETVSLFGELGSSAYKWKHAVLAANGAIYGIPFHASAVLKIDPFADSATTTLSASFGSSVGTSYAKWQHGVVSSSGVIYGIPCSANTVLRIDPATDTVTNFGDLSGAGSSLKWLHAVEAQNGAIYAVPYNANAILKIDPSSDTVTLIDAWTNTGSLQWRFGLLSNTGVIYCVPDKAESVLRIAAGNDTVPDNASLLGSFPGAHFKYRDGAVMPDGTIYGIPYQSGSVLKIDPAADTAATFGSLGGGELSKWRGAVVAGEGAVYAFPSGANSVLKVHPIGSDAPADGWPSSASTTSSAGVVGASIAFLLIATFAILGLVLHKRWQVKVQRSQQKVFEEDMWNAEKDRAGNSHNSTADSFSRAPSESRRTASSAASSWQGGPPPWQGRPPIGLGMHQVGATVPSFPVGARQMPPIFPTTAPPETGFFRPPSSGDWQAGPPGPVSPMPLPAHSSFPSTAPPRRIGAPPLREEDLVRPESRNGVLPIFPPSASSRLSQPGLGLQDMRSLPGAPLGSPPQGVDLPPPPPFVPSAARGQFNANDCFGELGGELGSPPAPPPNG